MGGNVKFTSQTRRYDRQEYLQLEREVIAKLWVSFIFTNYTIDGNIKQFLQPIAAYHTKESFGDMDIIINSDKLSSEWIPQLVLEFGLAHGDWSKNGNVLSFAYKNLQIDLIVTPPEDFQTSLDYFAWNDCGNLQGRLAHKLGFKLGHRGAELIVKDGDQQIAIIELTKDTSKIHELLDLNHQQWRDGFNTLEDMYQWIANSKYFNKDIYLLENRNHYSRTRDAKRKTYSDFLLWCQDKEFENNYPHVEITERVGYNIREPYFSELIVPMFPEVKEHYEAIIFDHQQHKLFKEKFNGTIIMEQTGLVNKELGMFMTWAKGQIDKRGLHPMFINMADYTIRNMITSLYFHYKNGWEWAGIPMVDAKRYIHGDNYAEIAPDWPVVEGEFDITFGLKNEE